MKFASRAYSLLACVIGACAPTLGFIELASCGDDNGGSAAVDAGGDGTVPEGGSEAAPPTPDAGHDATPDATADAKDSSPGSDASDASDSTTPDADAGFTCSVSVPDSGSGLRQAIANVVCGRWELACGLDAATFDNSFCLQVYGVGSGWLQVSAATPFIDGGRISYDRVAACTCLELNSQLQSGLIDQAGLNSIEGACLTALAGTSPVGDGGCVSSYECAPGGFCKGSSAGEGGLGTCTALSNEGGACTTNDMCNYVSTGTRALYCNGNACAPTLGAGATCSSNSQCASNNCLSPSCQGGFAFGSTASCDAFTIADAGGGG